MKKELLAPAGSFESLLAAVSAGADAVYTGGSLFSARSYAENLSQDELAEAIDYMHFLGRRLYLAVNTLLKPQELSEHLYGYLAPLYERGLDAVIVQDLGVFFYIKKHFPDLPIHASTQMTITGYRGASFQQKAGASRVVLARELELDEIKSVQEKTSIELECFVHGALCYGYSGQCLYSSLIGGRSGNRGKCAQPCRLPYEAEQQKGHIMSLKDMWSLPVLPDVLDAGVSSLKIEGRMKSPEYTAGVTRIYRKYLDMYEKNGRNGYQVWDDDRRELEDLFNRGGFCQGYYREDQKKTMITFSRPNHQGVRIGRMQDPKRIKLEQAVSPGDILEIGETHFVNDTKADKSETVQISAKERIHFSKNKPVYRVKNAYLLDKLKDTYIDEKFQEKINGKLILLKEMPAILTLYHEDISVSASGSEPQEARKQPLGEERIRRQICKTGGTAFAFDHLDVEMDENLFLPMQQLNALRRDAFILLEERIKEKYRRSLPEKLTGEDAARPHKISSPVHFRIQIEKIEQLRVVLEDDRVDRVYADMLYVEEAEEALLLCKKKAVECYLVLPWIFRERKSSYMPEILEQLLQLSWDGILVKNIETMVFLQEAGYRGALVLDHNMYTFQQEARAFWQNSGVTEDTAPVELNRHELGQRGCADSELIIYGHLPMMVSAQCMKKNIRGCDGKSGFLSIRDRMKKNIYVKNNCLFCYNIIYNADPLYLLDQMDKIEKLEPGAVRLSFTIEDEKAVRDILAGIKPAQLTRGHFLKGIQ